MTWQGKEYAEVVAQDWVDSAKYFMTKANASPTADIIYGVVKNGEAYFKGEITDFAQVGVKAKDKYTVEYTLEKPIPYFLSMLTYVSFLPVNGKFLAEQGSKFGTTNTGHALQRRLHHDRVRAPDQPRSSSGTRSTGTRRTCPSSDLSTSTTRK